MHAAAFSGLKADESRYAYYVEAGRRPRLTLYWWQRDLGYLLAIARAPLPAGEKCGLAYRVIRRGISVRRAVLAELLEGVGQIVGRARLKK